MLGSSRAPHDRASSDDLAISWSKGKVLVSIVVVLAFAAVGLAVAANSHRSGGLFVLAVGSLMVAIFGALTLVVLVRLFSSAPMLVVQHDGIDLHAGGWGLD